MAVGQDWYYAKDNEQFGPVSITELKRLASTGQLSASDQIWTEEWPSWKAAGTVKGLFATTSKAVPVLPTLPKPSATSSAPGRLSSTGKAAETVKSVAQPTPLSTGNMVPPWQWISVAAFLTVCCFPIGLCLIWFNPRLSRRSKMLWLGAFAACFICLMVYTQIKIQQTRADLAVAHQLWSSGDKQAAVSKYRAMIKDGPSLIPESDQSLVFGRVIDFDADSGNESSVQSLLNKADERHIVPSVSSEKARSIIASRPTKQNSSSAEKKASLGRPVTLDAKGVEDLIDNQQSYAGKVLVLPAVWEGRESLNQGGEGFYWPFEIGGDVVRTGSGSSRISARRTIKIRISSADVHAEFKTLRDLPNVGGNDKVIVKILFDGDFNNCRLLSLKRQ